MEKIKIKSKYKGIIYIILSAFCFAFMNAFVRLSGDLPTMQKVFFRNFVALFFSLAIILRDRKDFRFHKENLPYLILRSLCGTVGMLGNFYAVDHLVLSDASILNKMSPFFAILFSIILLKEKLKLPQAMIVLGAFVGALFIVKPTFSNAEIIPSVAGFLGGVGAGAAYSFVRLLGKRGENGAFIVFFFSLFSCLVTLPFLILQYKEMTVFQLCMLLLAGLSAAGGQFAITSAYTHAPAKEISVYDYSQIIFAAGLGFIFFGQVPDIYSFIGYIIIILMAIIMFMYNNKLGFLKGKKR